jgi:hypothetical protein
MKRSEVGLMIAECLVEPRYPDDIDKEVNYILNRLENIGMLPPKTRKERTIKDGGPGSVVYYEDVHEWDEE